jgi:HSP20 family protein
MTLLARREGAMSPIRMDMERMFDDIGKWRRPFWMEEEDGGFMPAVEMGESDDEVFVKVQVPGMKREDLQVELSDGVLIVKGEAKEEKEEKKKSYYRREFTYGEFTRRISLPSGVDAGKARAEVRDGVLSVHVPRTEEAKKHSVKLAIQ